MLIQCNYGSNYKVLTYFFKFRGIMEMKNNIGQVVGKQIGVSKDNNKPWTKIFMMGEFDDYIEDAQGKTVTEVFMKGVVDVNVGDNVEVKYSPGFQGKAQVTGLVIM
jgi:hypothetical protein